jgi:hypothetical protein
MFLCEESFRMKKNGVRLDRCDKKLSLRMQIDDQKKVASQCQGPSTSKLWESKRCLPHRVQDEAWYRLMQRLALNLVTRCQLYGPRPDVPYIRDLLSKVFGHFRSVLTPVVEALQSGVKVTIEWMKLTISKSSHRNDKTTMFEMVFRTRCNAHDIVLG